VQPSAGLGLCLALLAGETNTNHTRRISCAKPELFRVPPAFRSSFLRNVEVCYLIDFIGGCSRTRTCDPLIKSQMFLHRSSVPCRWRLGLHRPDSQLTSSLTNLPHAAKACVRSSRYKALL
jgi:hypothetical protein